MGTSFISERTAEMILIPELLTGLKPYYPKITPIYYWTSREGGIMSRESFINKQIKLLVLYARRPKVNWPGCGIVQVKLNQLLFDRAQFFQTENIPVIAGLPLADKLEDFVSGVKCLWLKINPTGIEGTFEIDLSEIGASSKISISFPDISNLINSSRIFSWREALDKINTMRRGFSQRRNYYPYLSGDPYKPVYLIIHQ